MLQQVKKRRPTVPCETQLSRAAGKKLHKCRGTEAASQAPMRAPSAIVASLFTPVLMFACLKGGTTGTPSTDDTGTADEGGTPRGKAKDGANGGSSNASSTDDTGSDPTAGTAGTDDTATPPVNTEGKPGDPCTLGSDCLSGICPKTTKTCDGCHHVGASCSTLADCCAGEAVAEDRKVFCDSANTCAVPPDNTRKVGEACAPGDKCLGTGGACLPTIADPSKRVCAGYCASNANCGGLFGPICDVSNGSGKGYCSAYNCTSSSQCSQTPWGHQCVIRNKPDARGKTVCGCVTDSDCPAGRKCNQQTCAP